jgi:multidrug resistance efflux pump
VEQPVSLDQAATRDSRLAETQDGRGNSPDRSPTAAPAARSEPEVDLDRTSGPSTPESSTTRPAAAGFLIAFGKHLATPSIALIALLVAVLTWRQYVIAPWTRDGTVRVQVANVAPEISGRINDVRVVDNQFVHKGEVLYTIEPFDFEVAQRTNAATVQQRAADLQVKQLQAERRQHLTDLATSPEEQQVYAGNAVQAKATLDAAQQPLAQAEINLRRTKIFSPVNGYVTNLLMRVGDFARAGPSNISVIDADSFWIDGYFEETKLAGICVGDRAGAKLMGYSKPIIGHVATITRGISVSNSAAGSQGLPNVDPVYTWVRLAQRVPVRIAIDQVPQGVPLVSGMTTTVTVRAAAKTDHQSWLDGVRSDVVNQFTYLFTTPPPRPNCLPTTSVRGDLPESIPAEVAPAAKSAEQINPGLTPGMDRSPQAP